MTKNRVREITIKGKQRKWFTFPHFPKNAKKLEWGQTPHHSYICIMNKELTGNFIGTIFEHGSGNPQSPLASDQRISF